MGTSVLHIKSEIECEVYLFDENKGVAKPCAFFNLEVRKGVQELLFISTEDENTRYKTEYMIENGDSDYRLFIEKSHFQRYSSVFLEKFYLAEQGNAEAQLELGNFYTNGNDAEQNWKEAIKWYKKSSEQGNANAQYKLGLIYFYGKPGVEQNCEEAVEWIKRAAKLKYEPSSVDESMVSIVGQENFGLVFCSPKNFLIGCFESYIKGIQEDQKDVEAARWIMKKAEQGDVFLQYMLGGIYFTYREDYYVYENHCHEHLYREPNYKEALKWLKKSAEQGHSEGCFWTGECYSKGLGVETDAEEAIKWYEKMVEKGEACWQYQLGRKYYMGEPGLKQNLVESVKWFRKAAEQGHPDAILAMGKCYYYGKGVEQNYKEAVEWFEKAIESKETGVIAYAKVYMGECYYYGKGVERNYKEAVRCFKKSNGWWSYGFYMLGQCYYYGRGVEQNYEEAVKWYKFAEGDGYARFELGECYYYGRGVKQDYKEAVRWYKKDAEQGNANAQYKLGSCYDNGYGIDKNHEEAIKWYKKAAGQGNSNAQKKMEEIYGKKYNPTVYLFFDTETSGLPQDYNAPTSDVDNWPRLIQLSWIIADQAGDIIKKANYIIRPNGFVISESVSKVHGITTQRASAEGIDLTEAIDVFMEDVDKCEFIIGHNVSFDKKIVGAELVRMGRYDTLSNKKSCCTMESTKNFCKISGNYGYKYPKLQELYYKLFGRNFDNAHNSAADVNATYECYWELRKRGVL